MFRTVDLFSGCGGMSLGFQQEGFDIIAAFEYWDVAAKCYSNNFSHPVYQQDLSDIDTVIPQIKAIQPDIIIGGPPCQDFSDAGKRIEASRAYLTECYAKIIAAVKPKGFVMENVTRAQTSQTYKRAREIFKKAGYGLTEITLDASLCGTPQKRKRFICFGLLGAQDGFAMDCFLNHQDKESMTLRDYFGNALGFEYYYHHPRNYNRRAVYSIDEPAPTIRGINRPIPKGYPGHPNDACPITSTLHALTMTDRALIQTFPADFKWIGNKANIEQMIGNAVPVNLARYIAKQVKEVLIKH